MKKNTISKFVTAISCLCKEAGEVVVAVAKVHGFTFGYKDGIVISSVDKTYVELDRLNTALRAAIVVGQEKQREIFLEEKRILEEKKKWGRNTTRELVETGWPREMVSAWWTIIDKENCDARRFKELVTAAKKDKLNFAQALGCRFGDEMQAFDWYKGGDFRTSKNILEAISMATGIKARKPADVVERMEGLPGAEKENETGRVWSF